MHPGERQREFSSTEHLSLEAVAAYADGELSDAALRRAQDHIAQCTQCHEDVVAQRESSQKLRGLSSDDAVRAPDSLVERLCQLRAEDVGDGPGAGAVGDGKRRAVRRVVDNAATTIRAWTRRG